MELYSRFNNESRIWLSTTKIHPTHAFRNTLSLQPACCLRPCSTARLQSVNRLQQMSAVEHRLFCSSPAHHNPNLQRACEKPTMLPLVILPIQNRKKRQILLLAAQVEENTHCLERQREKEKFKVEMCTSARLSYDLDARFFLSAVSYSAATSVWPDII